MWGGDGGLETKYGWYKYDRGGGVNFLEVILVFLPYKYTYIFFHSGPPQDLKWNKMCVWGGVYEKNKMCGGNSPYLNPILINSLTFVMKDKILTCILKNVMDA